MYSESVKLYFCKLYLFCSSFYSEAELSGYSGSLIWYQCVWFDKNDKILKKNKKKTIYKHTPQITSKADRITENPFCVKNTEC